MNVSLPKNQVNWLGIKEDMGTLKLERSAIFENAVEIRFYLYRCLFNVNVTLIGWNKCTLFYNLVNRKQ